VILTGRYLVLLGRNKLGLATIRQGHVVAQLVEALRYEPEGHEFDSQRCHWNLSLTQSFWPYYCPGVDSVSNINEYQEYFLGVKAAGA
jgi:hypothetical protein